MKCCLCGSGRNVKWCDVCSHYFCVFHRWALWGRVERTAAAVKELIARMPPPHCDHERGR